MSDERWKSSIRHKLCTSPQFQKGEKTIQGHFWTLSEHDRPNENSSEQIKKNGVENQEKEMITYDENAIATRNVMFCGNNSELSEFQLEPDPWQVTVESDKDKGVFELVQLKKNGVVQENIMNTTEGQKSKNDTFDIDDCNYFAEYQSESDPCQLKLESTTDSESGEQVEIESITKGRENTEIKLVINKEVNELEVATGRMFQDVKFQLRGLTHFGERSKLNKTDIVNGDEQRVPMSKEEEDEIEMATRSIMTDDNNDSYNNDVIGDCLGLLLDSDDTHFSDEQRVPMSKEEEEEIEMATRSIMTNDNNDSLHNDDLIHLMLESGAAQFSGLIN